MSARWKITYYESSPGKFPAKEFIDNLEEIPRARVYNTLELLAEFGTNLGLPHARKATGTPLWELRILGEKSLRIFYVAKTGKEFLILHPFIKKKQKTPKKEIKTAMARLRGIKVKVDNIAKL